MHSKHYDFVIVGSGAGGATLAHELSKKKQKVLVIERGRYEKTLGDAKDMLRFYDLPKFMPPKSKEGLILWRTFMAGGSTVVSLGNGGRCLQRELAGLGVHLENEMVEAEKELCVAPIDKSLLSEGAEKLMWASRETGSGMELMPKFIDPKKCRKCGNCQNGCKYGAKWSAVKYVHQAKKNGAEFLFDTKIEKVLVKDGKACGVLGAGPNGRAEIMADRVVVAAGGLATPLILQKTGLAEAGKNLFVDAMIVVYGATKGINLLHEPAMSLVEAHEGFILSPYASASRMLRVIELGLCGMAFTSADNVLGILVKIADEPSGRVFPDGSISKPVTAEDQKKFSRGFVRSKEILIKAGARSNSIVASKPAGSHPGGTAGIGRVVDCDLQTEIKNLFICDASVLPTSAGLPPIVTIVALAKRLSKHLTA